MTGWRINRRRGYKKILSEVREGGTEKERILSEAILTVCGFANEGVGGGGSRGEGGNVGDPGWVEGWRMDENKRVGAGRG